ncbi:hypothetical protein A2866_03445 [Candidatus Roizmanbacteria bacterium RIFCSPHIGHO2_01_FULL_39_8]|uniref:Methyltransferase domain-containing protein n=3 Tax=Candidatus Roizmaniibacteriota TaxID=1752723 RepID=A0A1F7GTS1_9BACT|nr:MAG: hypothetical protein A2866_03445 [Candidatus Roizmanbacteria bacterium RIFCSPHIGHO2_01_FULL_39_8]OGK28093.1 MAG: hypothetical protein A3C28_03200 [Candidatus Roizmanbacteria bacterium RIFCSPHIGHO2_02_FULL_39_9]OGK36819.1 MAG: hypothetical protein A3F60_04500 [Candidatus Roizmanbacteria bacterium RIFCSPHIGHO2_12_FULL_39_8]
MRCFLCNKSNFEEKYHLPGKKILCCKNDGVFLAQETKKEQSYGSSYFSNSPNLSSQSYYFSKLATLRLVTRKEFPTILDVGCGWGDFLEVLEKEKNPYLGIDINKEAIDICQKKELNCQQIDIKTLEKEVSKEKNTNFLTSKPNWYRNPNPNTLFDAITLFQVIEHLKNPIPVLQSAKKLLKKDGVLLITTPNNNSPLRRLLGAKWSVYNEPSHYVFYDKNTLHKVLGSAGFKKIQVRTDPSRFLSLRYILSRLNIRGKNILHLTSHVPVPTDPFGDLELLSHRLYIPDGL